MKSFMKLTLKNTTSPLNIKQKYYPCHYPFRNKCQSILIIGYFASYYCIFRFRILCPSHDCNLWYAFEKLFPCMELELSFLFLKSIYLRCCFLITWNKYLFSYLDRLSVNVNQFNWFSNVVMAKNSFYLYNGRSYPLQKIKYTAHRDKKIKKDQTTGNWFELLKCWITPRFYAVAHCTKQQRSQRDIYEDVSQISE